MKSTGEMTKAFLGGGLLIVLLFVFPLVGHAVGPICAVPPAGLISWWPGDGNANDITDGNPGTLKGSATFVAGIVEQAFSVDGNAGSFVEVPDAPNLNFGSTSPMTVDLWAFRTGFAPAQHILGKRVDCGSFEDIHYQMGLDTREGSGLFFGSYQGLVTTGADLPPNIWTHLAATFDGSTFRFYIDGQLAGTGTGTLGPTFAVSLTMGTSGTCHQFGQGFVGLIDEVEIFNRALSTTEIQAIFLAGSQGKCKELSFRLPFDGTEEITQGPGCGNHHGTQAEAIDYGLDLEAVYASERGEIIYADWHIIDSATGSPATKAQFGKVVEVEHPDGSITIYAHLESIAVAKGEEVRRGQFLGQSGNTGHVKSNDGRGGYHLHFERRVSAVDRGDGYRFGGEGVPISSLPTTSLVGCFGTATFDG
jgi:hypothetical protein